jgi:hypothetical protein
MTDLPARLSPTQGTRMTADPVRLALSAALLALLACSGDTITSPDERPASQLRLLHVSPSAPPLATLQTSFWAVKGRNAGVDLYYRPAAGRTDSTKFLEFRMGGASLDRRPDGSTIAQGDSVLITLQVTDATHLVIDYQPSGLRFAPNDLPKLKLFFTFCGDDLNYDGRVDQGDDDIIAQLGIWRQENVAENWFRLSSAVTKGTKQVEAQLAGFTGYALAY